ncbi:hypothetical protein [Flavobacterium subsaxonicum]|uniref:Lipoprotein n=1 Tax=Flavobacterium subsaxonicum WB 4.1-42 = DSM 21790 TaxID=1121898 RepID=A0A0A2MNT1_9FLAO|nr:hypothetical protein [Flavobacterium subsaxonicum]KGO93191.1 hypothetical protein Q766_07735 [Flavobacterium subsaxonicum WB 4.1-42 = DSM 21790]
MKIKITYLITITSLILFSCGSKEEEKGIKKEVTEAKKEGNYISKKWKSTKEIFVESDSIISARKASYFANQRKKYPEYFSVQKWFESNPKQLLNLKGDYYKMLKGAVLDEGTIIHKDLTSKSEFGTYKYLFVTEKAYFIYDLSYEDNKIEYKSVRRIQKGFGKEPMHDLIFDKHLDLEKEVFQGEVKQDLFTKNGHLFFEYEKKVNGNSVTNTIDLGTERKF